MAFMGGGNPISVAANFRLVFDTRSATRTATKYDAAMAQMANAGHKSMARANSALEKEHSALITKVNADNAAADKKFQARANAIFSNVGRKSKEAFSAAKKAQMEAAKGPRGGVSSTAYKKAEREYTRSLAVMDDTEGRRSSS